MAEIHETLEQVEHAGHHGADPFDKRVAVTMAIVAVCLAGIAMLGHRKHNEVLQLQGESNRLQTEANIEHTKATDQWGFYQAKNARFHMYKTNLGMLDAVARNPSGAEAAEKLRKSMSGQAEKYEKELPQMQKDAEKLVTDAKRKQKDSVTILDESHHTHHQADRLDYAHLGAEIGLVLCSIALLTKKKAYWFAGIISAILALVVASSAYVIPHDHTHLETQVDDHGNGNGSEKPAKQEKKPADGH